MSPRRRPARLRRPAPIVVLGLVGLGVLALFWLGRGEPLGVYAPSAYVERADGFIERGFLRADCSGDEWRIEEHFANASEAEITWYRDSYLADDVAAFNRDPNGFGWYFAIDESCRLRGVNPVVHTVRLPFGERYRWLGTIFYGGGASDARLRSAGRSVTLRHPQAPVPAEKQATTEVGSESALANEGAVLFHFAGGPGQPAARVHHVGHEVVVNNRVQEGQASEVRLLGVQLPLGRLARLATGDWLHLESSGFRPRRETFVFLGGESLEAASAVRLANTRYERTSDDPGLGRVSDPVREETYPYLDLVAQSIESSLAALGPARARQLEAGFDLQLTLERTPQERLTEAFRRAVAERARAQRVGRPVAAGLTVMDGKSGEVLALATHPAETDLAGAAVDPRRRRRLLQNQNLVLHPIGSAGKPFFFAAIADAHPFLMDLVVQPYGYDEKYRQLLQCELSQGYEVGGAVAPVDFRRALEVSDNKYTVELAALALAADAVGGAGSRAADAVDAPDAANAADTPLEALLPPERDVAWPRGGRSSGLSIGGRALDYPPELGRFVAPVRRLPEQPGSDAAQRCFALDRLEEASFRGPLGELTGASTYRGEAPPELPEEATRDQLAAGYLLGRYDLRPWRPLLAYLVDGVDPAAALKVRAAAQPIAPERVNLAFNQVSRLREGFVSLVLGGGNSSWTNVQLAEALARLVTGRQVEARLARRVLPRGEEAARAAAEDDDAESELDPDSENRLAPLLDLRPEARTAVLEGMARVIGDVGTGRRLVDDLAALRRRYPEDRIEMYAKTGSPTVLRPVPPRTGPALQRLIAERRLVFEGPLGPEGTLYVQPGGPGGARVPHRPPPQSGRSAAGDAFARALGRALGAAGASPRLAGSILPIVDEMMAALASSVAPEALEGPLRVQAGGVLYVDRDDRLFRQSLVRDKGAVLIFALVRLPGAAGTTGVPTPDALAAPDTRILTAAVHLDVGPNAGQAVTVTERVLPAIGEMLE